jgi:hypothetical protein
MPRNPTSGRKPGRPPKKIEPDVATLVADLAGLGHSQREIGILLGVDQKTIESRFSAEFISGKEKGKSRLRVKMIAMANAGSVPALLFALKTVVGLKEVSGMEVSGPNGSPVEVNDARTKLTSILSGIAARGSTPGSTGSAQ